MKIYEIDAAIEKMVAEAVNPETGEVQLDFAALDALQMERGSKVENLALLIKNKAADVTALDNEVKNLQARKDRAVKEINRMKDYLAWVLKGEKFETARVTVSFRRSKRLVLEPDFVGWAQRHRPELLRVKDPEPDKTAIRLVLETEKIPFASIENTNSMTVR